MRLLSPSTKPFIRQKSPLICVRCRGFSGISNIITIIKLVSKLTACEYNVLELRELGTLSHSNNIRQQSSNHVYVEFCFSIIIS